MAIKVQLFYNQGAEGWTETYYSQSTSQPRAFINAITNNQLYPFVAFRHISVQLLAIRATLIGASRNSASFIYSGTTALTGAPFGGVLTDTTADVTSTDAFCALFTAQGSRRPLYVRGLNDADVGFTPTGVPKPGDNLVTGLGKMIAAINQLQWCIQSQNRPPVNGLVWYPVTLVQASGDLTIITTPAPVLGFTAGTSQAIFQGIPHDDLPGFPRQPLVTTVTNTATGQITIPYRMRWAGPGSYQPAKMKFCLAQYTYTPIATIAFERFGSRKTGRAFGVPRGRSRAVIRAL